jgi:ribose 1,5-bisphosphokinase
MSNIPTPGRLIAVVGPSGVGKDTVMAALAAAHSNIRLARRVITRPSGVGGEASKGVTETEFATLQAKGAFAFSWSAHGLQYAIPSEAIALTQGRRTPDGRTMGGYDVLVNFSRAVLPEVAKRVPDFLVLSLTANPDELAARLTMRGRENTADITDRLRRAAFTIAPGLNVVEIANDGPLEITVQTALSAIYAKRAQR